MQRIYDNRNCRRIDLLYTQVADSLMTIKLEKWVIVKEVIATAILGYLAWRGISAGQAIFWIGVVNTVSIADLYKSYRRIQAENREDMLDGTS